MNFDNLTEKEEMALLDAEKWESGELGCSDDHVVVSNAPKELMDALNEKTGTKAVSIRLSVELIDNLKLIASNENMGYQTLSKIVLQRFVDAEIRKNYNQVVAEKIALEKELEEMRSKIASKTA